MREKITRKVTATFRCMRYLHPTLSPPFPFSPLSHSPSHLTTFSPPACVLPSIFSSTKSDIHRNSNTYLVPPIPPLTTKLLLCKLEAGCSYHRHPFPIPRPYYTPSNDTLPASSALKNLSQDVVPKPMAPSLHRVQSELPKSVWLSTKSGTVHCLHHHLRPHLSSACLSSVALPHHMDDLLCRRLRPGMSGVDRQSSRLHLLLLSHSLHHANGCAYHG